MYLQPAYAKLEAVYEPLLLMVHCRSARSTFGNGSIAMTVCIMGEQQCRRAS